MGELLFDTEALHEVPKSDCEKVLDKVNWLWDNRTIVVHHPLKYGLSGFYKRVLGKYRIIYSYETNPDIMIIHMVATRDSIYDEATKKFQ